MLIAFREVEDGLTQERYQVQRIETLEEQVKHTKQASIQLREQYYIGDSDYLDVLSSITQEQRLQRETLSARLDLILVRIGLYLALAGDFDNEPRIELEDFPVTDMPGGQLLDENSLEAPILLDPEFEPEPEVAPKLELQPLPESAATASAETAPSTEESLASVKDLDPPTESESPRRQPKPVLNAAFLLDEGDTAVAEANHGRREFDDERNLSNESTSQLDQPGQHRAGLCGNLGGIGCHDRDHQSNRAHGRTDRDDAERRGACGNDHGSSRNGFAETHGARFGRTGPGYIAQPTR